LKSSAVSGRLAIRMNKPIIVVGSINMDLVVRVQRQPTPGETILGGDYLTIPGGKGANQAVAAARAGGVVKMCGLVGSDPFGPVLRVNLTSNGVDTGHVGTWNGPSGVALITVDDTGQNMIVVSPGANGHVLPSMIPDALLREAGMVMLQLEIPLETVRDVIQACRIDKTPVLLNPAPAQVLPNDLLDGVRYVVANETEVMLLGAGQDELSSARRLRARGVDTVIVTLGERGVLWVGQGGEGRLPAHVVKAVDTTAAGDGFCGALAVKLSEGASLEDSLKFANAAGAIAVTRPGAQPSLASRGEIERFLAS
jgi:ribokinase